ncbi:DUF6265 family protein [Arenibacter sp. GZD96]|uniref:DUF6265 family protein n=1 Tax=Aurantibrevibacter litoralis TaxID=3106030 RepID=UPI002AFEB79F|nr:DUF6265 family protein [Arenibacter sp. GZD-96]MEA1787572.1 DUF6265 family protein [Arenibacter sp. GZD-96]
MKYLISCFMLAIWGLQAQNTISFTAGSTSPKAILDDVSWIAGHWKGAAFGGIIEEIWSPPLGDSMMFIFRLILEDKVEFYEIGHIQQVEETLILQLKHFHGNLEGWEERDEVADFKLVRLTPDRIYFDDFTFERIGVNEINIYVVILDEDGHTEEVTFNYKRVS